eukprot:750229-Hanusia_phi.AAC.5
MPSIPKHIRESPVVCCVYRNRAHATGDADVDKVLNGEIGVHWNIAIHRQGNCDRVLTVGEGVALSNTFAHKCRSHRPTHMQQQLQERPTPPHLRHLPQLNTQPQ